MTVVPIRHPIKKHKAIERMNEEMLKNMSIAKLVKASFRVKKESMRSNKEFDGIDYDPET